MFIRTINHIKRIIPYNFSSNKEKIIINPTSNCKRSLNEIITEYKQTQVEQISDYDNFSYKKQKINNRINLDSSYNTTRSDHQLEYDRKNLLEIINNNLVNKDNCNKRSGILFEQILCLLYENEGYTVKHTGGPDDKGVDLTIKKDECFIGIQAKNYSNSSVRLYLTEDDIYNIFYKMNNADNFTSARLHVYNDNIIKIRPEYVESLNDYYNYDIYEKAIYGKQWTVSCIKRLNHTYIDKIYKLFDVN